MGDRNITVTLKAGESFNAPWVVIGGDTLEEINHQLDTIMGAGTLQKAAAVAIAFHNGYRSLRHADSGGGAQEAPQETYSQPPVGAQPQGGYQGQQQPQGAPQGGGWASQPPPAQDPWANQPQGGGQWGNQGGQQASPQNQQQQQQRPAGAPNGPPVCKCGQQMAYKTTSGGKGVWRCPDWRYNNGNPTPGHDQIWAEDMH